MSKPILFIDFDGTLCHDRFWRGLPEDQYEKVQEMLFREDKNLIQEWMKGKGTAEEVNQQVADKLGLPFEDIWEIFIRDVETMSVSQEALQQIQELRDKYVTILITVNMDCFSRFTVPALQLNNYFDAISNSYYEGKFKSDNGGEIFKEYIEKYSAPTESCILIDDSSSACETFKSLGGIAYRVTEEEDLVTHLSKLAQN